MLRLVEEMKNKSQEVLKSGKVGIVLAWKKGELSYDAEPAFFSEVDELRDMTYDGFCASNLSKYLIEYSNRNEKALIFLKPCDSYNLNLLLAEQRVSRENIIIIGIACEGKIDVQKLRNAGAKGIIGVVENGDEVSAQTLYGNKTYPRTEVLFDKCLSCKGKEHKIYDGLIGEQFSVDTALGDKYAEILDLEAKSHEERFEYWRSKLSACIRCNACRNVCPSCSCIKCIFDNADSGVSAKVNVTDFEENLFHIIRAYHVAGRCSDCGECSRVCPQGIPLQLLNRKHIKDINSFFGEYQAGETAEQVAPLLRYELSDGEPNILTGRGGSS